MTDKDLETPVPPADESEPLPRPAPAWDGVSGAERQDPRWTNTSSPEVDDYVITDPEEIFINLKSMVDSGEIPFVPSELEGYLKESGLWSDDATGRAYLRRLGIITR